VKDTAQVLSTGLGTLATIVSVLVAFLTFLDPNRSTGGIVFSLAFLLLALVGTWASIKGRAWGALLIAVWMAVALAAIVASGIELTGVILPLEVLLAIVTLLEVGAAIVLARAPRSL
jgi:hypothetical protein